jgi:hypothetical protein
VRALGVLLLLVGSGATAYAVFSTFERRRPVDIAFALLSPIALTVTLTGALLLFVPGFFH